MIREKAEGKTIKLDNPSTSSWKLRFKAWERYEREKYKKIRVHEIVGLIDIDGQIEHAHGYYDDTGEFVEFNYLFHRGPPTDFWNPSLPSSGKVFTSTGYNQVFLRELVPK